MCGCLIVGAFGIVGFIRDVAGGQFFVARLLNFSEDRNLNGAVCALFVFVRVRGIAIAGPAFGHRGA